MKKIMKKGTKKSNTKSGLTKTRSGNSPSRSIASTIKEPGDWRSDILARIRLLINQVDPDIVEERKWKKPSNGMLGVPVWSNSPASGGGIICTGEAYRKIVKMTFAKGASLKDPLGLFNSSLAGNTRRAIDIHEDDTIHEKALSALFRAAVALNKLDHKRTRV